MERTLRTRITLLGAATLLGVASSCTGWLLDWSGTRCSGPDECGGTLRCIDGTCQEPGATKPDGSAEFTDTGGAMTEDTGATAPGDTGTSPQADVGASPGADSGADDATVVAPPDSGPVEAPDAGAPGLDAAPPGLDAGAVPVSIHSCGDAAVCYHQLAGEPLAVAVVDEMDVWVVGRNGMAQHWDGTGWRPVDVIGPWDAGTKDASLDTFSVVRAIPNYVLVASQQHKRVFEKRPATGPDFKMVHVADYPINGGWVGGEQEAILAEDNCEAAKLNGTTWEDNAGNYISGLDLAAVDGPDLQHLTMVGNSGLVARFEPNFKRVYAKRGTTTSTINDYFKDVKVFGDVRYLTGTDMNGNYNKTYVLRCTTRSADAGDLDLACDELATAKAAAAVWGRAENDVWIAGAGGYLGHTDGASVSTVASGKVFDDMIAIDGAASLVVAVGKNGSVMTYVPSP